jgi:hypothetical protein
MGKKADYLSHFYGYTSAVYAFIDFIYGKQRRERWLNLRGFIVGYREFLHIKVTSSFLYVYKKSRGTLDFKDHR